jgi:hypothetical protein
MLKEKKVAAAAAKQATLMERAAAMAVPPTPAHPFVPGEWRDSQGSTSSPSSSTVSLSPLFHDAADADHRP